MEGPLGSIRVSDDNDTICETMDDLRDTRQAAVSPGNGLRDTRQKKQDEVLRGNPTETEVVTTIDELIRFE